MARAGLDYTLAKLSELSGVRTMTISRFERGESQAKQCPRPPKIVVIVPAVMLQADRARE